MIESIRFLNFKALRDTTLPLSRFTLIVGANGSGKSTVFQALRALNRHGDYAYPELASFGAYASEPVSLLVRWVLDGRQFEAGKSWTNQGVSNQGLSPQDLFSRVDDILSRCRIYALDPKRIREPARIVPSPQMEEDGYGLAAVLDDLQDNYPERFEALVAEWSRWMPEYGHIGSRSPSEGMKLPRLRTAHGRHFVEAPHISDGTVVALAILTLAYLPNPPALLGFEDPDQGIHPRLLHHVQEALYRLAYPEAFKEQRPPVQVIATTHSPYFVDLFKDHPEEVVMIEKRGLESEFKPLSAHAHLQEVLDGGSLGEIWFSGILGGVPVEK